MKKRTEYDWLIVGAGMTGCVFARLMTDAGYKCIVVEKENNIGGMCYCEDMHGVAVHKYGAHIFHTESQEIWDFFCKYAGEIKKIGAYSVQAMAKGHIYPLPFNMNTFSKIWPEVRTPKEAKDKIDSQSDKVKMAYNLEDEAIRLVGKDVYELLIKGYTEKQWGAKCSELPKEIIMRLPVRFTYDNNYYYCDKIGVPSHGYNMFFQNILKGIEVRKCVDVDVDNKLSYKLKAAKVLLTCPIDEYFGYCFGRLDYRSLDFKIGVLDKGETQGCAVVNYCDIEIPYTRRIEHNFFSDKEDVEKIIVSYEYPQKFEYLSKPYYPINNEENNKKYDEYIKLVKLIYGDRFVFGGRLGGYKYLSMAGAIKEAYRLFDMNK